MKLNLVLYNQINIKYFDTSISNNFLYIHNNWKIIFNGEELNLNIKSYLIDYAMWSNFIDEINEKWFSWKFMVAKNYYDSIKKYCIENNFNEVYVIKPSENYVYENFLKIKQKLELDNIKLIIKEDNISFFMNHNEFRNIYEKPPVMEFFYRNMRKKYNILMDNWKPEWWKWNYDSENRKFDKNHSKSCDFNLSENNWIKKAKKYYNVNYSINYPTNRDEAKKLLYYFIKNHLDDFWRLEDAMYLDDYLVHHSNISTCINFWLLQPKEVVELIEKQETNLNNKEWFIRQILWWREFMYHFFHFYKDDIYKNNFFQFKNKLPDFFWNSEKESKMKCIKTVTKRVLDNNYSHHIERLMIIWNYTLLTWIKPSEINKWFFEKYTDAFEWVVSPNVLWMSQFSDWWKLATKPYISSWNYINKMSNYCKNCEYNVKTKYDDNSCPFNYLYWDFVNENKEVFKKTRQPFIIKNLDKIDIVKIKEIKSRYFKT